MILDLQYLREAGKIATDAPRIVETLTASIGLAVADTPFRQVVAEGLSESWARDPFDRRIAAQAKAEKAGLLTKDGPVRERYRDTFREA